ncbi:type I methionyl aminopeptidase [Variovorax paradoxus]|nr:type I methionyl aminopeptidase [Variovorax paradoxus]
MGGKAAQVAIKTPAEIAQSRIAGKLAAEVLRMIGPYVQPGVTTEALDDRCREFILHELQAIPANIGYQGFPKTVLTSVNHVVCHGIPSSDKVLKKGDIVNIDVAVIKDGWFGDTSRMYYVGEPKPLARRLVDTTYEAMCAGIREVRPGATLGDVGYAIQTVAHRERFSVVREYCGHGIGQVYHEELQVLHYGQRGQGLRLQEGMVFTIEPMLNAGTRETRELPDGWTVVTRDHSLSAQWEHMVAVTADGFEVLTPWPEGTGPYPAIGCSRNPMLP